MQFFEKCVLTDSYCYTVCSLLPLCGIGIAMAAVFQEAESYMSLYNSVIINNYFGQEKDYLTMAECQHMTTQL
jgi:hypothetical protein